MCFEVPERRERASKVAALGVAKQRCVWSYFRAKGSEVVNCQNPWVLLLLLLGGI